MSVHLRIIRVWITTSAPLFHQISFPLLSLLLVNQPLGCKKKTWKVSLLDRVGAVTSNWRHFDVILTRDVTLKCHIDVILMSFWCYFFFISASFWCHFCVILVSFLRHFWCHFCVILGSFWASFFTSKSQYAAIVDVLMAAARFSGCLLTNDESIHIRVLTRDECWESLSDR